MCYLSLLLLAAAVNVAPLRETTPAAHQTDDPAIWVNAKNPAQSLILGTVKMASPDGAVVVYRLDGTILMSVPGVDRPNNIDIAYGLKLGGRKIDIAVATERNLNRLRVFEILPGKGIRDLATVPVFDAPMGIAMYTRPKDGLIFAVVSRKTGPSGTYLWQYQFGDDGKGQLKAQKVREFGRFSNSKEIEAIAVDNEAGYIYYSDEGAGIRKYHADPAHPDAASELALFAQTGWKGDREGIAIYKEPNGKGYIIATDQQTPVSEYHLFAREGSASGPHDHSQELGVFGVGAATTDGIEVSSAPLGTSLPKGLFIAMNDSRKNFILVDWRKIEAGLRLKK